MASPPPPAQKLFKRPTKEQLVDNASWVVLAVIAYFALLFFLGDVMRPGETGFAAMLLWASAHGGAWLMDRVGLPPLMGMLFAGILLKNVGLVDGFDPEWSKAVRSGGLAIILLRSGLELDWRAVKSVGWIAARLTACPGVSEALAAGLLAVPVLGVPVFMGLSLGFILAAVSPAVVVSGMFDLQKRGYGVDKGIPSLVVAAASLDDVLAITGFSLFSGLAVPDPGSALWKDIVHGPLAVALGLGTGLGMGLVASLTALWSTRLRRSLVLLAMGLGQMYALSRAHYAAGGAMGALFGGLVAMLLWQAGWPRRFSKGPRPAYPHEAEHDLALLWKTAAQPLLFSAIGAEVDFSVVSADVLGKAIGVIVLGVAVRLGVAYAVLFGGPEGGLARKERAFVALSWIPKATVQAALASTPLDMVTNTLSPADPDYARYVQYARDVLTTAVFSIILTAPVGLVIMNSLGPRWLAKSQSLDGSTTPKDPEAGGDPGSPAGAAAGRRAGSKEVARRRSAIQRISLARTSARGALRPEDDPAPGLDAVGQQQAAANISRDAGEAAGQNMGGGYVG